MSSFLRYSLAVAALLAAAVIPVIPQSVVVASSSSPESCLAVGEVFSSSSLLCVPCAGGTAPTEDGQSF